MTDSKGRPREPVQEECRRKKGYTHKKGYTQFQVKP